MADHEIIAKEIAAAFRPLGYPDAFLKDYIQLECLSSKDDRETFLVQNRKTGKKAIAKCYDKSKYLISSEGDLLKALNHPGIPKLLDEYENERKICLVREYIEGITLNDYLKEKEPEQNEVIALSCQLAEILIYLHHQPQPVIHRDIKPENIIIKSGGRLSLIDFDIARRERADQDADTYCYGTSGFAPPEQYGFQQTDCRADIYAFGILLRYMLTGDIRESKRICLLPDLQHIIDHCTAFSPKDRYAEMEEVKQALSKINAEKKNNKGKWIVLAAGLTAVLIALFVIGKVSGLFGMQASGAIFSEPLIEKAVRIQLDLDEKEKIPAERLSEVKNIFIFGTTVVKTYGELGALGFENTDRGNVLSFNDVDMLPNLEIIFLAYQGTVDLSALSRAENLKNVTFKFITIADVSPLCEVQQLTYAGLYDCGISDCSSLSRCPNLEGLDAGENNITTMAQIGVLSEMRSLSLKFLKMDNLDNIEKMQKIDTLYLSGAEIRDVSALAKLPALKVVYATGDTYDKVKALLGNSEIEIINA